MSLEVFAHQEQDSRFPERELEDAYAIEKVGDRFAFVVADGGTRDVLSTGEYPYPSPAAEAARLATEVFIREVENSDPFDAFIEANKSIARLNKQLGLGGNYEELDLAGCVAAGGILRDRELRWAAIGDCEILIYDQNGINVFRSINNFEEYSRCDSKPLDSSSGDGRIVKRRDYRNNPNIIGSHDSKPFGALTGEPDAEWFIEFSGYYDVAEIGETEDWVPVEKLLLNPGDLLVAISDGYANHSLHDEFYENTRTLEDFIKWQDGLAAKSDEGESGYRGYNSERTIVAARMS